MKLSDLIKDACSAFGSESVMRLTDKANVKIPVIKTGIPMLDLALGVGGLPRGRIIEIYGPESSGKTTLALSVIAQAQRENDNAWIWYGDMEHALDPEWAQKIGVNLENLIFSQPSNGEECLEMARFMVESEVIDLIVVDSVASLVPKAELKGEIGDSHIGLQARMMSQAMRILSGKINKTKAIAIFINQIREKIGVMFGCFDYDTVVCFADGSTEKIGKIVNQKINKLVYSLNRNTGKIEAKQIKKWFNNGKCDNWLKIVTTASNRNGKLQCRVTKNHNFIVKDGKNFLDKSADSIKIGDKLLCQNSYKWNEPFEVKVLEICKSNRRRKSLKYDLEVEDNHNYLVGGHNGLIVHNSPETQPGGRALKFYASVRIDIRRTGSVGKKGEESSNKIKFTVKKNKVAPPFKICETELDFDKGFDLSRGLFEAGVKNNTIVKSGQTYSKGDLFSTRGKENTIEAIRNLGSEKLQDLYKEITGGLSVPEKTLNEKKLAKYLKKFAEAESDGDKAKWQKKIDLYKEKIENVA